MADAKPRVRIQAISRKVRAEAPSSLAISVGEARAREVTRRSRTLWGNAGPNAVQDFDLPKQRANSRTEVRRNGLADAGVNSLVTNIVGSGIKPQFTVTDADGKANTAFNRQLAELFLEWTDESDADGRHDFYGQQALAARSMIEGGDCFGRLRVRRLDQMETVPLQVQVLEAEYCPDQNNRPGAPATATAAGVNPIRAGVEFDVIGRRTAYHMTREHPNDRMLLGAQGNWNTVAVPASEVAHLCCVRRPGQVRGEPWLTRALAKLSQLDQYDVAQLERQKVAALFAGFVYEDPAAADGGGDEEEIFAGQIEGEDAGVDLAPLAPGTMQKLLRGERIEWSEPPSPGNNYVDFMREQKRGVSQAIGTLYEQLSGEWTQVNDRTFRAAVNEFRRRCSMWQHNLLVFQFCRPILRRWVELGVVSGRIVLPPGVTVARAARAKWVPEGWAYINPSQDIAAKQDEVRSGFRSRSEIVSSGGYDIEAIDAEIAADNTRADKLGLIFDTDPRRVSASGLAQARSGETQAPADADEASPAEPASPDEPASPADI